MNNRAPTTPISNITAQWARAGAMFSAKPDAISPDLERLLLDTARQASKNSRLFIMAATWVSRYADKILVPRLEKLMLEELDPKCHSILAMLVDYAQSFSGSHHLDRIMAICHPASEPKPLFEIERRNPILRKLSERHASSISQRWNLWAPDFQPKYDAIRPESWIVSHNPSFGNPVELQHA